MLAVVRVVRQKRFVDAPWVTRGRGRNYRPEPCSAASGIGNSPAPVRVTTTGLSYVPCWCLWPTTVATAGAQRVGGRTDEYKKQIWTEESIHEMSTRRTHCVWETWVFVFLINFFSGFAEACNRYWHRF